VQGEVAQFLAEVVVEAVGVRPAVHLEDVVVLVLDRRWRDRHVGAGVDQVLEIQRAGGQPSLVARGLPDPVPTVAVALPERGGFSLAVVLAARDIAVLAGAAPRREGGLRRNRDGGKRWSEVGHAFAREL